MKNKPILLSDSREKTPLDFSGDPDFAEVKIQKLSAGDYSIEGYTDRIVVERKADVNELLSNFYFQKKRLIKEMERLKEVDHVFIVIEQDLADVLNPRSYYVNVSRRNKRSPNIPVAVVMTNLIDIMFKYGIHVIFAGAHSKQITKSLLLAAYKKCSPNNN